MSALVTKDPLIDIVEHELGKLQTLHAFKMSGIVHPPRTKSEGIKNTNLRNYNNALKTLVISFRWLAEEHEGKKRRQEIQKWANSLMKEGRKKVLSSYYNNINRGECYAHMDASKAIINSFKQL